MILGNREPAVGIGWYCIDRSCRYRTRSVLNDPDYINVIGNAIAELTPDIERIDGLKDALLLAIYGTQAANGVMSYHQA